MSWKFVLSLIFALIVAVFAIQNAEPVAVIFLFKKAEISQALVILISAVLGALIVAFLGLISQVKLKATIRDDRKTIERLEKQASAEAAAVSDKTDTMNDIEGKKTEDSTV